METKHAAGRAALAQAEWRQKTMRMGRDPALAVDPVQARLSEDGLSQAFAVMSSVMLRMKGMDASKRIAHFEAACRELAIPTAEEGQEVWMGLLAWAQAHPPRAALLERVQQAFVASGRSWAAFDAPELEAPLLARALWYARDPEWRAMARRATAPEEPESRGSLSAEDFFLWIAGLVAWSRSYSDRLAYLTTGELREPLMAVLGIPPAEEDTIDGVLAVAGLAGDLPWDRRLAKAAGLAIVHVEPFVELVRRLAESPEAERATFTATWATDLGAVGEPFRRGWLARLAREAAERIGRFVGEHARALVETADLDSFERAAADAGAAFSLCAHFRAADLLYAWPALKDIAAMREGAAPPAPAAAGPAARDPVLAATWRYGRRLVARDPSLGFKVLLPLVEQHFEEIFEELIDTLTRTAPTSGAELEELLFILTRLGRARRSADALLAALGKARAPHRWAHLVPALIGKLDHEDRATRLARYCDVILERGADLDFLQAGALALWEQAGDLTAALEFCLRYHLRDPRSGVPALIEAARLAKRIGDWDHGGARVLVAAREHGEVVMALWAPLVELCEAAGKLPDVLAVVVGWGSRSTTPAGEEKPREKLITEWTLALELAVRIPGWELGMGQVWAAAMESDCPIPAVWRTLVADARARDLPAVVRQGAKRFIEAWGADPDITRLLWEILEADVARPEPDTLEIVDLLHWLHVDLGHSRCTSEAEFSHKVLSLPGITPRVLGEWALRKLYSSRRWKLLGAALVRDQAALDALLEVVADAGHPISFSLEGLVAGLPEEESWSLLVRLLPNRARHLEWAWSEVLHRWRQDPANRARDLTDLLYMMPPPAARPAAALEADFKLLLAYQLADAPESRWGEVASVFVKLAGSGPLGPLVKRLTGEQFTQVLLQSMLAELVEPLESDPRTADRGRALRAKVAEMIARTSGDFRTHGGL